MWKEKEAEGVGSTPSIAERGAQPLPGGGGSPIPFLIEWSFSFLFFFLLTLFFFKVYKWNFT